MVRGIYQGIADKVTEGTDIADQIINSMTGPEGKPLKKVEIQDDYMAKKNIPEMPEDLKYKSGLLNEESESSESDTRIDEPEDKDGNDTVENKGEENTKPLDVKELEQ